MTKVSQTAGFFERGCLFIQEPIKSLAICSSSVFIAFQCSALWLDGEGFYKLWRRLVERFLLHKGTFCRATGELRRLAGDLGDSLQSGRRFIEVEIDEDHFQTTCRRLAKAAEETGG